MGNVIAGVSGVISSIMVIVSFVCFLIKPIREKILKKISHTKSNDAGVCCLLRQAIISECKKADEQGFLYFYDEENLNAMFQSYTDLGGNGTIKDLVDKTLRLPINMGN